MKERNNILKDAVQSMNMHNKKDDASIYAEGWAVSFRKLSATQQLYAKKAIEDILILGQLNQLSLNSVNAPTSNNFSIHSSASSTPFPNNSRSSTPFVINAVSSPSPSSQQEISLVELQTRTSNSYGSYQQLLSDTTFH